MSDSGALALLPSTEDAMIKELLLLCDATFRRVAVLATRGKCNLKSREARWALVD